MTEIMCLMPECRFNTRTSHLGGRCMRQSIKIGRDQKCDELETDYNYILEKNALREQQAQERIIEQNKLRETREAIPQ